jgi:S1-C subfamily serine protease
VIVAVDGEPITSSEVFRTILGSHTPGDRVELEIVRGEEHLQTEITVGNRPVRVGQ